ncbi:MAG: hypothetical protein JNM41_09350 [Flavipsychrobacter sp.]|nr:hypothetical protein [Flavipsychrobacter sp.]
MMQCSRNIEGITSLILCIMLFWCPIAQAQFFRHKEREYSLIDVRELFKDTAKFQSPLLHYRGSDTLYHHFTRRVVDDFMFIRISRSELYLADVRPYRNKSSESSCCYFLSVNENFKIVPDR